MSILLSLLLAQTRVLPEVDRRAIELQARAEAVQAGDAAPRSRRTTAVNAAATPRRVAQTTARPAAVRPPVRQAAVTARVATHPSGAPATIRRASNGALDLDAITTICRAAGNQADPAAFLGTLTRAYALDGSESRSLRTSCAAYLAGRADARSGNFGAPAH